MQVHPAALDFEFVAFGPVMPDSLSRHGFPGSCGSPSPLPIGNGLSARERSRQPKPSEHGVLKAGHGADPVAGEGEDVQADSVADAGRGAQVDPERRLTVGSRRHEVEPAARAEQTGAEAGDDISALVCEGIGGIEMNASSVSRAGHQRVEIGGLPRADELRHDRILGR